MNKSTLIDAVAEAKRFITKAEAALNEDARNRDRTAYPNISSLTNNPRENGAVRRASMDLTRKLADPASGRAMQVWSTAPGVQVYAGHGLKGDPARDLGRGPGQGTWLWQPGDGICLEPMEYPDAPNHLAFPVRWWLPGDVVRGSIVYRYMGS